MKIRTDFVTNSSSSCFTVEITIRAKGARVSIEEDPYRYNPDGGGEASFTGDLRDINEHLGSVQELATWLASSMKENVWGEPDSPSFKRKKSKFVKDACTRIQSVRDIESITVMRRYSAWGEFAELVADRQEMIDYAQRYLNSEGIEKERAEAEMITYIHTAEDARGETFGENSSVNRFSWNGRTVEKLAQRLCSQYGPGDVSGVEYKELNLRTGEYFDYSEFDVK